MENELEEVVNEYPAITQLNQILETSGTHLFLHLQMDPLG